MVIPWFISNGTVQNTDLSADADVLANIFAFQATYGTMECICSDKIKEQNTRTENPV